MFNLKERASLIGKKIKTILFYYHEGLCLCPKCCEPVAIKIFFEDSDEFIKIYSPSHNCDVTSYDNKLVFELLKSSEEYTCACRWALTSDTQDDI